MVNAEIQRLTMMWLRVSDTLSSLVKLRFRLKVTADKREITYTGLSKTHSFFWLEVIENNDL